jgi:hypothetical protein
VREGYAQVATYPPDVKYQDRLLAAQQQAVASGAGLGRAARDRRRCNSRLSEVTATRPTRPCTSRRHRPT